MDGGEVMPRAALLSWDKDRGVAVLSAGPNTFYLAHTGDMQKDAESFAGLCRFLQVIAPNLPPADPLPRPVASGPLPEITDEELRRAQVFTYPAAARGIRGHNKLRTVSQTELLDIIEDL